MTLKWRSGKEPTMPTIDRTPKPPELLRRPDSLPRGLIPPSAEVREALDRERAKHRADAFAKDEERLLNEWTVGHYFDGTNLEVLYRPTPDGPVVLAVGFEEIRTMTESMKPERMEGLKTYAGY
jgi:hypothetical protein